MAAGDLERVPADRGLSQQPREDRSGDGSAQLSKAPAITMPKGGGAIRSIGEKFAANPVTGTGSMTVPIPTSPGRAGSGPSLALAYDSGSGNGPFGFGWSLSLASVSRRTDRGIPRYRDSEHSDVFTLSGADDLVPVLVEQDGAWVPEDLPRRRIGAATYLIQRYRPRIEGMFARIERWTNEADASDTFWRSISKENATTWYGRTAASRIADPADPTRIFRWLVCEHHDDKGNVVVYEYKREDSIDVDEGAACERNRTPAGRAANVYPKRIKYGNRTPYFPGPSDAPAPLPSEWLFEVVFDYGEHDAAEPLPGDTGAWHVRDDPFSSYRAGFEVRTYRLCQRVLMFHHFPGEPSVGADCLVRSTDLTYSAEEDPADARNPVYSLLVAATQVGYQCVGAGDVRKALPPVEFEYSRPVVADEVRDVDAGSVGNLPAGLDGAINRWVDLDGEGISGVLTQQGDALYYKRNLSPIATRVEDGRQGAAVSLGPMRRVAERPSLAELDRGGQLLVDLAGDGTLDLVDVQSSTPGFYERSGAGGWDEFRPFDTLPNLDWTDPNLRFVDLTGDGHADVAISEDDAFTFHPSLAEEGFGEAERMSRAADEERGPRLVFSEAGESVFLADLSGDGLVDLVRIRNGEVCYWPSLGYGSFGAKVTMDNSPLFDRPDIFSPSRLRLADIDGSGTTDLIYLGGDGVTLYFNECGNGWSRPERLTAFPAVDDVASIQVVDLLGNGTACLVWSSPLPGDAARPMRYVDLMGGQKPHLLIRSVNNLGGETAIGYAPSTKFYLADEVAGRPWITRLPFPVHVVETVEVRDRVAGSRLTSRYEYHHGYFDGLEREFRGFAMIERHDTEAFEDYVLGVEAAGGEEETAPELFQPPVTTRTWYHTGALTGGEAVMHPLRAEYFLGSQHLPDPTLPEDVTAREYAECLRALRGLPLRQEVFSFDGSPDEKSPYGVVETTYDVRRLQARAGQRHAVFFAVATETVTHSYERNPADPRRSHNLHLELDELGNPVTTASVVYGRLARDPELPAPVQGDQERPCVTYTRTEYTRDIDDPDPKPAYRLRVPYQTTTFELTGANPAGDLFTAQELRDAIAVAAPIPYEAVAGGAAAETRRTSQRRTLFRDDHLDPLPAGKWDTLGLELEGYRLAFADGILEEYAGKVARADLVAGGYVDLDGDGRWWAPSGRAVYPAFPADHFYGPVGGVDPLGTETIARFDEYDLLPDTISVTQAPWNVTTAENDYRVLGPVAKTDPNGNRSAVELDPLGMVVKLATMGKAGADEGDTLDDPTVRMEYDLDRWMTEGKPAFVRTLSRERHQDAATRWQESIAYSNGSGGVAMVKARVHPGPALSPNPDGTVAEVHADPRWVGNGRTVLTNKGLPVKEYEPYFSVTSEYEDEDAVRRLGVTPVMFYDAVGRGTRTAFPDGTLTRIEIDAWSHRTFDANDTVVESDWYAERGSPDPAGEPEPADPERRAAWLTARHGGTPGTVHFDSMGRAVYAVSDYGGGLSAATRFETDLTGRYTKVHDTMGRRIAAAFNGLDGVRVHSDSPEKGRHWTFVNVAGAVMRAWDEHGRELRTEFDELQRPVAGFAREPGQPEVMTSYMVFGDRHPDAAARNLLGAPHQVFDQAGVVQVERLDFKGNPERIDRVLARTYDAAVDWRALAAQPDYAAIQSAAATELEDETFTATMDFDALGRTTSVTLPDGTSMVPTYAEASLLRTLTVQIAGQGAPKAFLTDQDFDAKGRRLFARHGNGVETRYAYDPDSSRLSELTAFRTGTDPATEALQRLLYTYDPVGNVVELRDDAQQTHFFNNAVVEPRWRFEYDALYQLVRASGREHAGGANDSIRTDGDLEPVGQLPHPNDATAVRRYTEEYDYDLLGNLTRVAHRHAAQLGAGGGWTRHYRYAFQDDPADATNRLTSTSLPGDADSGPYSAAYEYDVYGNMTKMPHLSELRWNSFDQLERVDLAGGGVAHYVYGAGGQRIRKVIEHQGGVREERIYLGPLEIYRERAGAAAPRLERQTVHVHDSAGRVAQVDTKTIDTSDADPANPLGVPLVRYEYDNQLGSAILQTDAGGAPISYEEYHPWGTSAYRSSTSDAGLSLKRYRFSGKERDETGLYAFGARYYAAWLGRWTSSDPGGVEMGTNLYRYCRNNPTNFHDPTGLAERPLNPAGRVSWEIPRSVFMNGDQRLPDAQAIANFESWLSEAHPDRTFTPGSVTIDWSTANGRRGPTYNAEWTGSNGQPLLPRQGEFGSTAPMRKQPRAQYADAANKKGRKTENEHVTPRAQQKAIDPNYKNREYRNDVTVRSPRGVSLDKTAVDNQQSAAIQQRIAAGQPVNITEDIDMPANQNFHRANEAARAAGQPHIRNPGSINRGTLEQMGDRFERGKSQSLPPGAVIEEGVIEEHGPPAQAPAPSQSAGPPPRSGSFNFGAAATSVGGGIALTLTRALVPGVAEAEIAFATGSMYAYAGGYAALGAALETAAAYTPVVGGSLVAGAIGGNAAESLASTVTDSRDAQLAAGVIGAAAVGAAVGALIGSVVPIAGTVIGAGAGAAIGAAAGLAGYLIAKYW